MICTLLAIGQIHLLERLFFPLYSLPFFGRIGLLVGQNGEQLIMDEVPVFVADQLGVWYTGGVVLMTKDD